MQHKILIVEDEVELAEILAAYLKVEGFEVVTAADGSKGMELFYKEHPVLVLLDIMLPGRDGVSICKEIRVSSEVPVIMLSAKSGEMDKVVALGVGADDYVTKPFRPLELVARVKAQLRRYEKSFLRAQTENIEKLVAGELVLSPASYEAVFEGKPLELTTKEFEVLLYLVRKAGRVLSKTQIYENVWGYEGICDDNSITVYVNRLREKIGKSHIATVWGAGYKFIC